MTSGFVLPELDRALEWCEAELLRTAGGDLDPTSVALVDLNQGEVEQAAERLGVARASGIAADVRDTAAVETAVAAGVISIHVELRAGNRAAYALYRKMEFAETLRLERYYRGRETAVQLVLQTRGPDHDTQILEAIRNAGYEPTREMAEKPT